LLFIEKSSSDMLRLLLFKAGFDEEFILVLKREQLMLKYAENLLKTVIRRVQLL